MAEIESAIRLMKIGDAASLAEARKVLGITLDKLSTLMGMSENILKDGN